MRALIACTICVAAAGCAQIFGLEAPGVRGDAAPGDAGPFCFGTFTPPGVCFMHEPTGEIDLLPQVSTDDACSADLATEIGACVIAAQTVRVSTATRVRGGRPLVLVATERVEITGTLDVAGHLADGAGPGAVASCAFAGMLSKQDGGAGGSYQALGGDGGIGGGGSDSGTAVAVAAPTSVRGGCPGETGGPDTGATATGLGGGGGGAVWLIGGAIAIMGTIDASGSGGKGAQMLQQGGGGGGAGGMIVLDSPMLDAGAGTIFADGGGGGAGANGAAGGDGGEPDGAVAAAGGTGPAGAGGAGAHGATLTGERGGNFDTAGAGGGGGAAGWIFANGCATCSPAATAF